MKSGGRGILFFKLSAAFVMSRTLSLEICILMVRNPQKTKTEQSDHDWLSRVIFETRFTNL